MRQSKTVTAFLVLTAAVSLAARQSSTSQPQQRPTFRSGTNLVLVDVYPMKDGRILQNLEQTDFEVFEDGKPQKVENFQFIKVEGRAPEAEKRDPNTQEEGNELAADPKNRVFVVYLDTKGVSIEGAYRSRRPLVEMLNRIMAPNDLFGVVTTEMAPAQLVLGRKLLTTEDMLARYWPWGQRGSIMRTQEEQNLNQCTISPTTNKEMYVDDRGIQRRMIDVMIDRLREDKALEHLESTITYMSGLRQTRTALIVFTEGWLLFQTDLGLLTPLQVFKSYDNTPAIGTANGRPIISTSAQAGSGAACLREMTRLAMLDNRTRYNDLLRRAARANVVFYPVNPIGLTMFDYPIWQDATPTMPTDPNQEPKMLLVEQLNRIKDRADGLLQAAETTGGIAVVNTNKIESGLDRIAAQLEAYYVLGYYSTNQAFDGRYRQISVKLKVPGVQISARKGYTAPTKAEMAAMDAPKVVVAPEVAAAETAKADALGMLSRIRGSAELYGAGVQTKTGEV
ncbi:MAG: VWA domain-containing protein, partial [Acidobacteria bacterium]